ncbi:hypothetical protein ACFLRB_00475 [Acidobacteriota bacterium]
MNKKKKCNLFFLCVCVGLALFFITFKYLHVETDLKASDSCPICTFEKTASLFHAIFFTLLSLIDLYLIATRIYIAEATRKLSLLKHILGQRAPPPAEI